MLALVWALPFKLFIALVLLGSMIEDEIEPLAR
jgi:hypothetical protein